MPVANKIASLLYIKTLIVFDIVFFGTIPVVSYLLVILGESFNFDVPVFFEWFGRWIGLWFMPFDVFVMGAGGACLLGPFVIIGILLIFLSGVLAWKGSLTGFYFLFFLITVSSVVQPFGIYIQNYYININGGTVDLFSPTLVSRVAFSFWVITSQFPSDDQLAEVSFAGFEVNRDSINPSILIVVESYCNWIIDHIRATATNMDLSYRSLATFS